MDGLEIKLARVRFGLTLSYVGERVGLHAARISEMERGKRAIADDVITALGLDRSEVSNDEA